MERIGSDVCCAPAAVIACRSESLSRVSNGQSKPTNSAALAIRRTRMRSLRMAFDRANCDYVTGGRLSRAEPAMRLLWGSSLPQVVSALSARRLVRLSRARIGLPVDCVSCSLSAPHDLNLRRLVRLLQARSFPFSHLHGGQSRSAPRSLAPPRPPQVGRRTPKHFGAAPRRPFRPPCPLCPHPQPRTEPRLDEAARPRSLQ